MDRRDIPRSFGFEDVKPSFIRKTFALRTAALSWAKHREVALEDPGALTRILQGAPTLAKLIRRYIETFETISKWQRSKQAHLEFLERHALGKSNALALTSADLHVLLTLSTIFHRGNSQVRKLFQPSSQYLAVFWLQYVRCTRR